MELTTKPMFRNSSKPLSRAAPQADERSRQASRQGLGQVQLHMIGGPSRDADTEEVHVLSPDRVFQRERARQDRPVVFISAHEALSCQAFKRRVCFQLDNVNQF